MALALDGNRPSAPLVALPQLEALTLYVDRETAWLAGPSGLLAQAPRLRTLELHASAADEAPLPLDFLASAPQLQTLARALSEDVTRVPAHLTLLTAAPPTTRLGARFLARAPQVRTVRIGATAAADAQTDLGAAALAAPAAFLADLPRLRTVELRTPLRDPPPTRRARGACPPAYRPRAGTWN